MPIFSSEIKELLPHGLRLDRYVSEDLRLLLRSQIKARNLKAKINGKDVKFSRTVKQGDMLELSWDDSPPVNIIPENIPLEIIFENDKCIVINKAQGLVVHPGAGNRQGTLANALCFLRQNKGEEVNLGGIRPGIVHRLDKETSGIIIAAWDEKTHEYLSGQFKSRNVRKNYIAIVNGAPKEEKGKITTFIKRDPKDRKRFVVSTDGKNAVTFYKVLKNWHTHSLLLLKPKTGRTHQLRVHMRHIGCPILGDPVYASGDKQFPKARLMLHSKSLFIQLPDKNEESVFSSPVPERFLAIMEKLDRMNKHG